MKKQKSSPRAVNIQLAPPVGETTKNKKIALVMDEEQLHILLRMMEGIMAPDKGAKRGEQMLDEEVELAAKRWIPSEDNEFNYEIIKMAPVYRQLVRHWADPDHAADSGL